MYPQPKDLRVEIIEITGQCPTYKVGDTFMIKGGYQLVSNIPVCLHGLQGLVPYYVPLSRGISPYDLGLTHQDDDQSSQSAFLQCQDPAQITGGSSVIYRIWVLD